MTMTEVQAEAAPAVAPLRAAQIAAVSTLLASAFDDDPAYSFLFPVASQRAAGLSDLFARNLRAHLPYGCTYVLMDGSDVVATVTIRPPGGIPLSLPTMLRRGLLPFAARHGLPSVVRLLTIKRAYDLLEADAAHGATHRLVHMMAVAPARQGRGLGARLLTEALERSSAVRDAVSRPILLTTHSERNVTFYRRSGFEVCEHRTLAPGGGAGYPVWTMRRPPG